MEAQDPTYQTTHDTANKTMTHHMDAGLKIFVDFKNQLIVTSRNGEVKDKKTFSEIGSLQDYENHVAKTAADGISLREKGFVMTSDGTPI